METENNRAVVLRERWIYLLLSLVLTGMMLISLVGCVYWGEYGAAAMALAVLGVALYGLHKTAVWRITMEQGEDSFTYRGLFFRKYQVSYRDIDYYWTRSEDFAMRHQGRCIQVDDTVLHREVLLEQLHRYRVPEVADRTGRNLREKRIRPRAFRYSIYTFCWLELFLLLTLPFILRNIWSSPDRWGLLGLMAGIELVTVVYFVYSLWLLHFYYTADETGIRVLGPKDEILAELPWTGFCHVMSLEVWLRYTPVPVGVFLRTYSAELHGRRIYAEKERTPVQGYTADDRVQRLRRGKLSRREFEAEGAYVFYLSKAEYARWHALWQTAMEK